MDTKKIIELMKGPHTLLPDIPTGRKDGMFFSLDNGTNAERRRKKKTQSSGMIAGHGKMPHRQQLYSPKLTVN